MKSIQVVIFTGAVTAKESLEVTLNLLWKASKLLSLRGLWQRYLRFVFICWCCEKHPSCYLYGGCDSAIGAYQVLFKVVKSIQVVIFTGAVTAMTIITDKRSMLWKASKLLSLRGLWQLPPFFFFAWLCCEKHPSCYLYGGCDSAGLSDETKRYVVKSIQVVIFTGAVTAKGQIRRYPEGLWKASKLLSLRGLWQLFT